MKYKLTVVFNMEVPEEAYDFSTHDTEITRNEFMLEIEKESIMESGIAEYVAETAVNFPVESWNLVAVETTEE